MLTPLDSILQRAVSLAKPKPIESIEIRLNESDNLGRKKVQRIVGSSVTRKPVADDGKSLRSGRSAGDSSAELGMCHTPTTIDSLPASPRQEDISTLSAVVANPFKAEKGFESDLEYRILSTPPEGSSTPRILIDATFVTDSNGSPKRVQFASPQSPGVITRKPKFNLDSLSIQETKVSAESTARVGQKRLVAPVTYLDHHAIDHSPDDCKRMKKHPSPNKQYLENLEAAFQHYHDLKMSGADDDELDELAGSFSSPPRSLGLRDRNRLVSGRSFSRRKESPGPRFGCPSETDPLLEQPSRLPRSVLHTSDNPLTSHKATRFAPLFRPSDADADGVDELQ